MEELLFCTLKPFKQNMNGKAISVFEMSKYISKRDI